MTELLASIAAPLVLGAFLFFEALNEKINWPLLVLAELFTLVAITVLWLNMSNYPGISLLLETVFVMVVQIFLLATILTMLLQVTFDGLLLLEKIGVFK